MLRTIKPKTARGKRAVEKRAPKLIENAKTSIFLRGTKTSLHVDQALKDLCQLKKPDAKMMSKRNPIHPFEDASSIQFLSEKNDSSLFMFAQHSKKRPHTIVLGRMFNFEVMDMFELMLQKITPIELFKTTKCALGAKPSFSFNGDLWDTNDTLGRLKNLFLDFYRGEEVSTINLAGLEHVISLTATSTTTALGATRFEVYFRVYRVHLKKSGSRLPRIELEEMGPSLDFVVGRTKLADADVWKVATYIPKSLKVTKVKNVTHDSTGDKLGRVHMGSQNIDGIQTRKMKGLKKRKSVAESDSERAAPAKNKRARVAEDDDE